MVPPGAARNEQLLVVDNYDSFTYNVVQYLGQLQQQVKVIRNDEYSVAEVLQTEWPAVIISPGPCTPDQAGISMELIAALGESTPILGICLGHQSIAQCFGGSIIRAREPMHGKLSMVYHDGRGVFKDIPSPFEVTRYHSLIAGHDNLPESLEVSAWTQTEAGEIDEIMALRHRQFAIEGVQFHPEAIATHHGHRLLANFLNLAGIAVAGQEKLVDTLQ